ncbi:MAG TPA: hypothetical protein VGP33_12115 [Chloroflexota bacterium]|nr:hypothetical protein [Chloroflexota bacterium]
MTLTLPAAIYHELQQRAHRHQRNLEDEATLTLIAAVDVNGGLPADLAAAIDALAALDIDGLWRVSQSQPTMEDKILLDTFVDKRRHRGPTPDVNRWLTGTTG